MLGGGDGPGHRASPFDRGYRVVLGHPRGGARERAWRGPAGDLHHHPKTKKMFAEALDAMLKE